MMEKDLAEMPEKRAASSQDSFFPQEKSTEKGEVTALRLTARSQFLCPLEPIWRAEFYSKTTLVANGLSRKCFLLTHGIFST